MLSRICANNSIKILSATDNPVRYGGVNSTVLRNYGVDEKVIAHIANAYRLVFHGQTSVFDAVNQVVDQVPDGPEIQNIVKFIRETKLGIISKRMSPVGSLACVSCLKFNLHSVDSSHSCSFKTKVLRVLSPSNKDQRS